jgi:adenylate kinase
LIIILSGTPGTGKTTLAEIMSPDLSCTHLSSSTFLREHGLTLKDPSGRLTEIVADDLEPALHHLATLSGSGKCILLETVYPALWLESRIIQEETALIILLRTHPSELCRRLTGKGWPKDKVFENCLAEAFNTVAEDLIEFEHDVIEVDTTHRTPAESYMNLLDKIKAWDTGIKIDWMTREEVADLVARLASNIDFDKYRLGIESGL